MTNYLKRLFPHKVLQQAPRYYLILLLFLAVTFTYYVLLRAPTVKLDYIVLMCLSWLVTIRLMLKSFSHEAASQIFKRYFQEEKQTSQNIRRERTGIFNTCQIIFVLLIILSAFLVVYQSYLLLK